MKFLQELHEARMTRDENNQRLLTYSDCCERFYLTLLAVEFMHQYPSATPFVRSYCKKSLSDNYKHFKISGTDLYNFIYFIIGDEHALGKLKDPGAAKKMQSTVKIPLVDIKNYLTSLSTGNSPFSSQQLFIRVENGLNITNTDYKNIRRRIGNYTNLTTNARKSISTTLLYALRAKLRNSDIIDDFSKLISSKDLESEWVNDNEPTISKLDIAPTTAADLSNYRLLVKSGNLMLIKGFLNLVKDNKPIPGNMVQAYAPLISMLDDIVKAGPSYISMLKTIQKQAKTSLED